MSRSYLEANARERMAQLLDAGSFEEFLPPSQRVVSPHLGQLDAPVSFDDGVVVGRGSLNGTTVFAAAQEGGFMGGAVGEVHGAKLVGLIAVSEVMRAVLDTRARNIPVIVLIGGANGCFGGMGIAARCANIIIMSEEARLAMSGPEVIETANGVEEFDSRDRALVWRTTGGKHRYLLGDCQQIVADDIDAFRRASVQALQDCQGVPAGLSLAALEAEQDMLAQRISRFGTAADPLEIWSALGLSQDQANNIAMLEAEAFVALAAAYRVKG